MGGLSAGLSQSGRTGCGRGDAAGVRQGSEEQSVQDLESDVLGVLLPASGDGGGDSEAAWRWDENPWDTDGLGQSRPNGGGPEVGGEGRTDLSPRLIWLSTVPVGPGRGGGMSGAVLEDRLGDRFGHPKVLGCIVTPLLSLIVMVKTVLPGWLGGRYEGLFGVRGGGGRVACV